MKLTRYLVLLGFCSTATMGHQTIEEDPIELPEDDFVIEEEQEGANKEVEPTISETFQEL